MRSFLLKIRFLLFPKGSRLEWYYHQFRLFLFALRTQEFDEFLEWLYFEIRHRRLQAGSQKEADWFYRQWMNQHKSAFFELYRQRRVSKRWPNSPLISIIITIEGGASLPLEETIHSIRKQSYPNWELCLVSVSGGQKDLQDDLNKYARKDYRIRVFDIAKSQGEAENLNTGIQESLGDYLVFMVCGDLLAPNALFEIGSCLYKDPSVDLVYFDEDQITHGAHARGKPWFKPSAPSPDLLLSTNYLAHAVMRRNLVLMAGKFDSQMNHAYNRDLAFKIFEGNPLAMHISDVLYHVNTRPEHDAIHFQRDSEWAAEHKKCIEDHLHRIGYSDIDVDILESGDAHVHWPVSGRLISILIPTKDKASLLDKCLKSILELTTYPNYEIILVDTGSVEEETALYYASLEKDRRIRIVRYNGLFNFHTVNNYGVQFASGSAYVFLNNDTEVLNPDWLTELVGWAERREVGVVGAKLIRPDGTIQHAGLVMGLAGHGSHAFDGAREPQTGPFGSSEWYRDYQAVTGACMCVRRDVFEELNGFDEIYQVGYGDIDLCLRAFDAGYRVVYNPFARLLHHEGATRRFSQPPSDVLRASVRMQPRIARGDPYFNPNLSVLQRIPSVREPYTVRRDLIIQKIHRDFDLSMEPLSKFPLGSAWLKQQDGLRKSPVSSLRALVITHELTQSGAPMILLEVARELKERGMEVLVVAPEDGSLRKFCQQHGLALRLIPNIMKDVRFILWMLRDYDFVLANTILAHRAVHAARAFGKPSFWWIHESNFGQQKAMKEPGVAMAFDQASAVLFPAQATADLYASFTRRNNFHVLHNGAKVPPPGTGDLIFSPDAQTVKVVVVGSIESRKGQDVLLEALALLSPSDRERFDCLFIGRMIDWAEPEFCGKIQKKARDLGNVRLTGPMTADQVGAHLRAADIFVLPSRDEVLPLSVIEAMALGKAVICTRVGGVAEIVEDGLEGMLVRSEDPESLAGGLLKLMDGELRNYLGRNARERYQRHLTPEIFHQKMWNIIEQVYQSGFEGIRLS